MSTRTLDIKGGWIVRSHIGNRVENHHMGFTKNVEGSYFVVIPWLRHTEPPEEMEVRDESPLQPLPRET